jgi:hypothetical protein
MRLSSGELHEEDEMEDEKWNLLMPPATEPTFATWQ